MSFLEVRKGCRLGGPYCPSGQKKPFFHFEMDNSKHRKEMKCIVCEVLMTNSTFFSWKQVWGWGGRGRS